MSERVGGRALEPIGARRDGEDGMEGGRKRG